MNLKTKLSGRRYLLHYEAIELICYVGVNEKGRNLSNEDPPFKTVLYRNYSTIFFIAVMLSRSSAPISSTSWKRIISFI